MTLTHPGQPLALSTSWNGADGAAAPSAILEQAAALGFRRVEAYQHFTTDALGALAAEAAARGMEIGTLHGPCPVPADERGQRLPWADPLSSTAEPARLLAVDALRRTIDAAAGLGAGAIVVHLGTTGIVSRQREVFESAERNGRDSEVHRDLVRRVLAEREAAKGPALAAGLRSIRALGEHARGTGVRLGVETRDGYHEIPSLEEMAEVLAACEGLPVGYWHDAGHGAKLEFGGFWEHEAYLRRYGQRLVGMHVHDTRGPRDHLAPGEGTTDFAMLARYLPPDSFKTLELHPRVTAEQITRACDLLRPLGTFGVREGVVYRV